MGFTPYQMRAMSLWEYGAYLDGWRQAHETDKEDDEMTPELFRLIMDAPVKVAVQH
jgi:hypothetical protein